MSARLKVDENLPSEIAELMNRHGCDALTVADQGWRGMADDELWGRFQAEGRWLAKAVQPLNSIPDAYQYAQAEWQKILLQIEEKFRT